MPKVLITWASSWLWNKLVDIFLATWYDVICLSRNWSTTPDTTNIPLDLSDKVSIEHAVSLIQHEHDNFSLIVCCAWIGYIEQLDHIDYDHTEQLFQVNITWHAYLLSKLAHTIKKNNADLVFVWATIWYKANEHMPLYSVSKRGLRWLVENRRTYLKQSSCRVLHISPGWMDTASNIWPQWRETIIAKKNEKIVWTMLDTNTVAEFIFQATQLPKNMEIAEVIINRK